MTATATPQQPASPRIGVEDALIKIRWATLDGCHNPEGFMEWLGGLSPDQIIYFAENLEGALP